MYLKGSTVLAALIVQCHRTDRQLCSKWLFCMITMVAETVSATNLIRCTNCADCTWAMWAPSSLPLSPGNCLFLHLSELSCQSVTYQINTGIPAMMNPCLSTTDPCLLTAEKVTIDRGRHKFMGQLSGHSGSNIIDMYIVRLDDVTVLDLHNESYNLQQVATSLILLHACSGT